MVAVAAEAGGGVLVTVNDPNYAFCAWGLTVQRLGDGSWLHEEDETPCTHSDSRKAGI